MNRVVSQRVLWWSIVSVLILASALTPIALSQAQTAPVLSIASDIPATTGQDVTVPVVFTSNGSSVASITFSIDFDETNLSLDETDGDLDGIPDSIVFSVPAAFGASVIVDLTDTDGELDFAIFDGFPPISSLVDGTLATITFTAIGDPGVGNTLDASVVFSTDPEASFGDPNAVNVEGSTVDGSVLVEPQPPIEADIGITKSDDADPVTAGNNLTYTLNVVNGGPEPATNVVVTDTLPAEVGFVSASAGCTEDSGVVTCDVGNLANGEDADITIVVSTDPSTADDTTLTNTATVTADEDDSNAENDTATETTLVVQEADISVTKEVSDENPNPNDTIVYTIVVTNNGPSDATGVEVTDNLPAGVSYDSDDSGGDYNSGTGVWTVGDLGAGESATLEITATVDGDVEEGATITNTAAATADQTDPEQGNNADSADINIPTPGVGIFIDPDFTRIGVNQLFEVDILVQAGEQDVSGIQAFVDFDPSFLEVQQLISGSDLVDFFGPNNGFDNVNGEVEFVAGNFPVSQGGSGFPDGTFVLATIQFLALAETPGTPVDFATVIPRKTKASVSGEDITGPINDGVVEIVQAVALDVTFRFQGQDRPIPDGWQQPVRIIFDSNDGGGTDVIDAISEYDANNGQAFVHLPLVLVGNYDVSVRGPSTLTSIKRNVDVTLTTSEIHLFPPNLQSGDATGDEFIDVQDFTLLSDSILKVVGEDGFDPRADFDANGTVDVSDIGLIILNLFEVGPVELP